MTTHSDPRLAQQGQPQFPPPGFTGEQLPHHLAPEHAPPPQPGYQQPEVDLDAEYTDYFGFEEFHTYVLPDGRQWIQFKTLTEGDLAKYQSILKRDVVVEKATGNARLRIDQVEERHALLQVAVTNWNMKRKDPRSGKWIDAKFGNGSPGSEFMKWLQVANPQIVHDLAEAVRKANPSLLAATTETIEAIDKQIEDLIEQRKDLVKRQQGEGFSATS